MFGKIKISPAFESGGLAWYYIPKVGRKNIKQTRFSLNLRWLPPTGPRIWRGERGEAVSAGSEAENGWGKMSVIGCHCHHYWHQDMICASVQQCSHDEMISQARRIRRREKLFLALNEHRTFIYAQKLFPFNCPTNEAKTAVEWIHQFLSLLDYACIGFSSDQL